MGGGGAAAAAIIAARNRRIRAIVDAFRLTDATSPDRARSMDQIGLVPGRELDELVASGVVLAGPRPDTWYLSEIAYIARRDSRMQIKRGVLVVIMVSLLVLLAGMVMMRSG